MINSDFYYTIKQPVFSELKIKSSIFLAGAYSVGDSTQATEILKSLRSKYYDANHNCFAYKINYDGSDFRYSDDGEPSGTAGKPIFFMISKYELTNILVVVTRFFGGTKLGVGGLVRAYSDSAELVLSKVEKLVVYRTNNFRINCTYNDVSLVKKFIEKEAVEIKEEYTDSIIFNVKVLISKTNGFVDNLFNITNGRVKAEITD
jgi:uncharacterized YigZ family protein